MEQGWSFIDAIQWWQADDRLLPGSPAGARTHEVHVDEAYAYEMHAYEMHADEAYAYEMHTYEVHAAEAHTYEMMPIRYTPMRHMPVRCTPMRCMTIKCNP